MEVDTFFRYFLIAVFAAIAITFIVNVIRHGGIKAALFGAPIERTVGEVTLARGPASSTTLRVHVLTGETEPKVGLELVSKSIASYHMAPFTLTAAEARELITLLESASSLQRRYGPRV